MMNLIAKAQLDVRSELRRVADNQEELGRMLPDNLEQSNLRSLIDQANLSLEIADEL